jgi:alpha-tubulin suppressor-like RCC1 family protein
MNDLGQLGASTAPSDHSLVPVLVSDDAGFTSLSLADNHAFALRGDELYGWGTNSYGELGFGDTLGRRVPTLLSSGWRAVSAGVDHTCAIRDTGALYCWGFGGQGQLGLGVIANYLEPQEVMPGTTFTAVAAFEHTCAITTGGALYCWGKNDAAQAGTPRATPEVLSPLRVGADTDWSAIAAGRRHTCGLRGTALYCFGENAEGQLGRGAPSAIADPVPALVAGDHRWAAVSLGAAHTIARTTGNELYGWGDAGEGELGIGAAPPASVGSPMRAGTATDWRLVEGGTSYSCGVRGGAVHCFGMNRQNPVGIGGGQLGLGDRIDRFEPAPVCLP